MPPPPPPLPLPLPLPLSLLNLPIGFHGHCLQPRNFFYPDKTLTTKQGGVNNLGYVGKSYVPQAGDNARLLALINTTDCSRAKKSIEMVVMVLVTVVGSGGNSSWRDHP